MKYLGWSLTLFLMLFLCSGAALAKEENTLTMYVAYGGPEVIAQKFEEATGIKVAFLTMSSGEVLTRLRAEKANPGADVWFGGGSDAFIQAKKEGLTQPFVAPNAKRVGAAFKDPDGYWTGVSLVVVGFLVNKDRLASKGLKVPVSWAELASPEYMDEVSASNPNTSGTAYTTISGVLQIKGEEAGWPLLDKLYANIPFLTKSGSAPGKMALAGEYAVGIAPDPHNLAGRNPDAPLAVVFPEDGVLAWPSPVSIIANAKHPENAKAFVDWCLTPEGQQILMEASPRVPTTDVETLPGVPSLSQLNLVPYDILHWGNERERVMRQFNERFPKFQ
ncbi:extracellular solute-binding protein [Pseudodesulfovibrio sp. S3]|nr:extracellular solute-binding protein [Pseudodesulfovibrio sp. S3]